MAHLGTTKTARKFNSVRWLTPKELYDGRAQFVITNVEEMTMQNFLNPKKTDPGYRLHITVVAVGRITDTVFENNDYKVDVRAATDSSAEYWDSLYEDWQGEVEEAKHEGVVPVISGCYFDEFSFTSKRDDKVITYYRLTDKQPPLLVDRKDDDDVDEMDDHPF